MIRISGKTVRTVREPAYALVGILGILSILAWFTVSQSSMPMAGTLDPLALLFFTMIWAVGMVAMMFPSLVPIVYTITVSARRSVEETGVSSGSRSLVVPLHAALFVLGYVAVWTLVGVFFYSAIAGLALAGLPSDFTSFGVLAGGILVLTGVYQFTGFKRRALMKCRSPLGFIMSRWRKGGVGAGVMGLDYGFFCTKCCWVLMAGLLTVGAMSLLLMGVFAIIIFAEKVGSFGAVVSKIVGAAFLAVGAFLII